MKKLKKLKKKKNETPPGFPSRFVARIKEGDIFVKKQRNAHHYGDMRVQMDTFMDLAEKLGTIRKPRD